MLIFNITLSSYVNLYSKTSIYKEDTRAIVIVKVYDYQHSHISSNAFVVFSINFMISNSIISIIASVIVHIIMYHQNEIDNKL